MPSDHGPGPSPEPGPGPVAAPTSSDDRPVPPPPPPSAPATPAPPRPVQPPTRLHPFSMVRGIDPRVLLQVVVPLGILAAQVGPALDDLGAGVVLPVTIGLVLVVLGAIMALRYVVWQRHTYELTGDAVVERRGILNRRERTVQLARLQQVEVEQGILDRMVGTAVVRLETASDASEVELEVVSLDDARRLRSSLLPHAATPEERATARELVHVPLHHVALASVTGRRLLLIPVLIAGLIGFLGEYDLFGEATDVAGDAVATVGAVAIVAVVVALLLVSVVVALAVGVLRDGDFRIREVGDDLHVRRGLLANREAVLPRTRLQKVTISYGLVRRMLGFASLTLHSAGGGGGEQGGAGLSERQMIVPLVPAATARRLLLDLLPDAGPLPELQPHPPRARRRARVRHLLGGIWLVPVSLAPAWWLTRSWGGTAAVGLAVLAVVGAAAWWLGARDHANRGSALGERWVVARHGALAIEESVSPRTKAQGSRVLSTPFQRRRGLATLVVNVAGPGGAVTMLDLGTDTAEGWAEELVAPWRVS
jgi:putative membrane protein